MRWCLSTGATVVPNRNNHQVGDQHRHGDEVERDLDAVGVGDQASDDRGYAAEQRLAGEQDADAGAPKLRWRDVERPGV